MITYEIDVTSTTFSDTTILTYKIELPPSENEIALNLLHDGGLIIPYVIYSIPNLPASYQLPTQVKKNCGSLLSMEKILPQIKMRAMRSSAIKLHVENTRSRSVY